MTFCAGAGLTSKSARTTPLEDSLRCPWHPASHVMHPLGREQPVRFRFRIMNKGTRVKLIRSRVLRRESKPDGEVCFRGRAVGVSIERFTAITPTVRGASLSGLGPCFRIFTEQVALPILDSLAWPRAPSSPIRKSHPSIPIESPHAAVLCAVHHGPESHR